MLARLAELARNPDLLRGDSGAELQPGTDCRADLDVAGRVREQGGVRPPRFRCPAVRGSARARSASQVAARRRSSGRCDAALHRSRRRFPGRSADLGPLVNPGSSSATAAASPARWAAIGPTVSNLGESGQTPAVLIRPYVVFSPVSPQKADEMRIEPRGAPTLVVPSDKPWIFAPGGHIADPKAPEDPAHELRLTVEVVIAADVAVAVGRGVEDDDLRNRERLTSSRYRRLP